MNITLASSNEYVQHCAALIMSIQLNNIGVHIDFNIISDGISEINQNHLRNITNRFYNSVNFYLVNADIFSDCPVEDLAKSSLYITTYYRLLIPSILPDDVKKTLYLDCDIIVNHSLKELWDTTIEEDTALLAVEDNIIDAQESCKRLHIKSPYSYFNAGVLLMNLCYLRKINFTSKALSYGAKHKNILRHHDQDILNALLYDKTVLINMKWNMLDCFLFRHPLLSANRLNEYEENKFNPYIIHYSNYMKPWFKECNHPYKYLYYQYLSHTPFNDYISRSKYN